MSLEIKGSFKAAGKPFEYAEGKTITKFYLDIDQGSQFPGVAEFQYFNNNLDISKFKAGDQVVVGFNIRGKKWEKDGRKGFNQNLVAWKIYSFVETSTQQPAAAAASTDQEDDGLPF